MAKPQPCYYPFHAINDYVIMRLQCKLSSGKINTNNIQLKKKVIQYI